MMQLPQAARQARGMAVKASAQVGKKELAVALMSKHPKLFSNKDAAEDAVKAVLDSIVDSVSTGENGSEFNIFSALSVAPTRAITMI